MSVFCQVDFHIYHVRGGEQEREVHPTELQYGILPGQIR